MQSEDLFLALDNAVKFDFSKNPFWWPNTGKFEVIVGAILVQNTNWKNAELALENLRKFGLLDLEKIANLNLENLANIIKPSGFYNQKAKRLNLLCNAILSEFGDFESFKFSVSREWLISQKGIGLETCDAILCYGCGREIMVCDKYTANLLRFLGYEFESYEEMQEWLESIDMSEIWQIYPNMSENEIFARFHGIIVEFCKEHFKNGKFDQIAKNILLEL